MQHNLDSRDNERIPIYGDSSNSSLADTRLVIQTDQNIVSEKKPNSKIRNTPFFNLQTDSLSEASMTTMVGINNNLNTQQAQNQPALDYGLKSFNKR